jgi:IS5 family transposase
MLIERHAPVNLFALVPLERDEILDQMDQLLDEDPLFQEVKADLARRYPKTLTRGRPSTPVEVILRMLVVKHLHNWSYEETEDYVADSITLRQFCRVYLEAVPDDTTLIRWANVMRPQTLHRLLAHVARLAQRLKVTRGRKLRTDGTVVESHIHHPTDSRLLLDGVRVLGRTVARAKKVLQAAGGAVAQGAQQLCRNSLHSARQLAREIKEAARKGGGELSERCRRAYRQLVRVAQSAVQRAAEVQQRLAAVGSAAAQRLVATLERFRPVVAQVLDQTRRRVFQGESVPAAEKIVSLFEPHAAVICRGKEHRPTEFGHKIWLDEVDGGLISNYRVLAGNPSDEKQWGPSLTRHQELFGHPPWQASADRGVYSAANEDLAREMGVQRIILPKPGYRSEARKQHERQRWFRRGRRYHQGIEGRISLLKRRYGLDRCRDHGEDGFERAVGWGLLAYDLLVIGTALAG